VYIINGGIKEVNARKIAERVRKIALFVTNQPSKVYIIGGKIAEKLGISVRTAEWHKDEAKKRLKQYLTP